MLIRDARSTDATAIRSIVFDTLDEYGLKPDPAGTDADLDDVLVSYVERGGFFEVVEDDDGTVVGTMGVYPLRDGVCELRKMYLRREIRGRGIGRELLERAITRARAGGFRVMELETAGALREAIALYERRGFTRVDASHLASRCDRAYTLHL